MATIGLRGGSGSSAGIQINGTDFLSIDTETGLTIPVTINYLDIASISSTFITATGIAAQSLSSTVLSINSSSSSAISGILYYTGESSSILQLPTASGTIATTSQLIGKAQTWQIVTRGFGTTYTNTTSAPIMVYITCSGSGINTITVGGVAIGHFQANSSSVNSNASFIVPVGATYSVSTGATLAKWSELRE